MFFYFVSYLGYIVVLQINKNDLNSKRMQASNFNDSSNDVREHLVNAGSCKKNLHPALAKKRPFAASSTTTVGEETQEETQEENAKMPKVMPKRNSSIWSYYKVKQGETGREAKVICQVEGCGRIITRPQGTPTAMVSHLRTKHHAAFLQYTQKQKEDVAKKVSRCQ